MEMLERALDKDPSCVVERDRLLCDKFAAKVNDADLRRMLKIHDFPNSTFRDIREEAIASWMPATM